MASDFRAVGSTSFFGSTFGIIVVLAVFVCVTYGIQHRFLAGQNITFILFDTTIFASWRSARRWWSSPRRRPVGGFGSRVVRLPSADGCSASYTGFRSRSCSSSGSFIGLACGVVNGLIVAVGRVPSLVVTLPTLYIIRGIDGLVVGGGVVVASSMPNRVL